MVNILYTNSHWLLFYSADILTFPRCLYHHGNMGKKPSHILSTAEWIIIMSTLDIFALWGFSNGCERYILLRPETSRHDLQFYMTNCFRKRREKQNSELLLLLLGKLNNLRVHCAVRDGGGGGGGARAIPSVNKTHQREMQVESIMIWESSPLLCHIT